MLGSGSNLMKPFVTVTSIATPLDRANVDTDQVVPKQFLKLVQKTGFGKFLFYDWRFEDESTPKKDFVLNDSKYVGSKILLTRANFGSGSSREHAAWALKDYGFDVIIASSFADIFYSNCFKNGILPITLDPQNMDKLFQTNSKITIDLKSQIISFDDTSINFEIENHRKKTLLEGLDDITLNLAYEDKITLYEKNHPI